MQNISAPKVVPFVTPADQVDIPAEQADLTCFDRPLVLATDLAGTFAGGTAQARGRLYATLRRRAHTSLLYVTPQSLRRVQAFIERLDLPEPDVLLADAGTSIATKGDGVALKTLQDEFEQAWPGAEPIRTLLKPLSRYLGERLLDAPYRVSYFVRIGFDIADVVERVRSALSSIDVNVVMSRGSHIDVLPSGVDMGGILRRVLIKLEISADWVVVCGGLLNQRDVLEGGYKGILPGNAQASLKRVVADRPHVLVASAPGAAGVLEGLVHFGFVEPPPV